ncbi:MAG: hypothetical protein V1863_03155 [Candidatus Omnitrophota bacterium]
MLIKKAKSGFTFLELLITSGVIIIALTGLLATYITCYELNETSKNSNLALTEAQRVMEEIFNTDFLSVPGVYNGFTFAVSGLPAGNSVGRVTVDNSTNPDLLNVTVGVCWRQRDSRIIGECVDSSGILTFSDANINGVLDSPVQLQTLVAQR